MEPKVRRINSATSKTLRNRAIGASPETEGIEIERMLIQVYLIILA
jgi:hypothetical protein